MIQQSPMNLRIVKFWTTYKTVAGQMHPVEMVEYCAPGMATKSTTVARVKDLQRTVPNFDSDNVAAMLAAERWRLIERAYVAWKQGQEIPQDGTPLAAWPGLTSEQAEVFRSFGLRSVEDVAHATTSIIQKVQLPNVMAIQTLAKSFLAAKDQTVVASALAAKDAEVADLKDQLEELRQLILQQQGEPEDDDDAPEKPKRRGRPPKADSIEVTA